MEPAVAVLPDVLVQPCLQFARVGELLVPDHLGLQRPVRGLVHRVVEGRPFIGSGIVIPTDLGTSSIAASSNLLPLSLQTRIRLGVFCGTVNDAG